ncbi:MAG TPA: trigger factor [Anaerohalosphaeraceae bacterium]|nr:trigger factor [Anaerohalosphaeraceae bacterium]
MAEESKDNQQNETQDQPTVPNVVKIEDIGPCKKKVTVEVPEEKIKALLDEKYKELRQDVIIPGFRRGRAPIRLLEKRFGTDVRNQVKLQLMAESAEAALKDNKVDYLGDPDIKHEEITLPDSGPLVYSFEVEVRPEFELPNLEGIEIRKPKVEVTEESIQEEIESMRKRSGMWVPKEEAVEAGDQVIADVIVHVEGEEGQDKQDSIEIFVRDPGFVAGVPVEGLAELLRGAKHGDERTVTVDVPSTYFNERFRGKKVDIKITVKEVKMLKPAELNEEFFSRFGVSTLDELKGRVRDYLETATERQARAAMVDQVYAYLQKNIDFDLPADMAADQSLAILQRRYVNLLMQGVSKEEIEQQMDQLRASSDQQAKEQLKLFFIMSKIADQFGIEVTEEEINGHIAAVAAQRGRRPEKMREELARDGSLAQFALQVREQKCIEKILEKAKIIETEEIPAPAAEEVHKPRKRAEKKTEGKHEAAAKKEEKETAEKHKSREETQAKRKPKAAKKDQKEEK